jgi:hypothetical protein
MLKYTLVLWALLFSLQPALASKNSPRFLKAAKASSFMLLAPSSQESLVNWLNESYFVNNDLNLTNFQPPKHVKKKRRDIFEISGEIDGAKRSKDNHTFTLIIKKKKGLIHLTMKMPPKYMRALHQTENYRELTKSEFKIEIRKLMLDHLRDIKSYWE